MEKWQIERYGKPYLMIDDVLLDDESGAPVLVIDGRFIDIEGIDVATGATVARTLSALRSPDAPDWSQMQRRDTCDELWRQILDQLDNLAIIGDATPVETTAAVRLESESESALREARERLPLADGGMSAILTEVHRSLAALVLDLAREQGIEAHLESATSRAADPFASDNFYVVTLLLQARYWRRSSPLALVLVWWVVECLRGETSDCAAVEQTTSLFRSLLTELGSGVYDESDLRIHVKAALAVLLGASTSGAARLCRPERRQRQVQSGINFLLDAERAATEALAQLGPSRFIDAAARAEGETKHNLTVGCYVEEYHVTRRFVEMITPMLAKRLVPDLRQRMFRYFSEEVGHEAFELATCKSLGVHEEALSQAAPLALRTAFVDTFTTIAESEPVGYLISIFVTEGMLGDHSPLNDLLETVRPPDDAFKDVHKKHEELNVVLNHSSLSRLMLSDVTAVSSLGQYRALECLLYLIELNHRGWNELHDHYVVSGTPPRNTWTIDSREMNGAVGAS